MRKLFFGRSTRLVLGFCVLMTGCGKKSGNEAPPEVAQPRLEPTEVERLLKLQEVTCSSNQACPNYISKVVVLNGDKFKYCTGFLVSDDIVATSSSCIPKHLRRHTQNCAQDLFFFFPPTAGRPAERVGCSEVLQVSPLEGGDPLLWRDDVSFLRVNKKLDYRRQVTFNREGIMNNEEYSAWFVDQVDDFTALIRRDTCEALHNGYINPLASNESSPNLIFANCVFKTGNSGAPILDSKGRVRAMVSTSISSKLRDYLNATGLLTAPLKLMLHATNFACAPTVFDNDVLDERECFKDLRYSKIDELRFRMFSTETLFSQMRTKFEDSLKGKSRYVRFGVKMISKGDVQELDIYPKCFKPLASWLSTLNRTRNNFVFEVTLPFKTFRRTMDSSGRIVAKSEDAPEKKYYMQFSLKTLRRTKSSVVLMWDQNENRTFPDLTDQCEANFIESLF